MPDDGFAAQVRYQGDVAVIDMEGEVNGFAQQELEAAYLQAMDPQPARILLDFKDVRYINSTGIALIVGLLAKARTSGQEVLACGLTDHYREIFEITRLADFMRIFSDERSALEGRPAASA